MTATTDRGSIEEEVEEYVTKKVASGTFTSPSEVLAAGLEALRDEERDIEQWLMEEVVPTLDELETNPSLVTPIDQAFAEIREHHAARVKSLA